MKTKVLKTILAEDETGQYIPFCNYERHRGFALRWWICEQRECYHYQKHYVLKYKDKSHKSI